VADYAVSACRIQPVSYRHAGGAGHRLTPKLPFPRPAARRAFFADK
jgi:hypothetical protein